MGQLTYLLDTNVISEPVKPNANSRVLKAMEHHKNSIAIAAPVWHELNYGCARLPVSRKRNNLVDYLTHVIHKDIPILPYDERAALWHAEERARLSVKGIVIPYLDGQIAAIAAAQQLILVSRNIDDFKHFKKIEIENWFVERRKKSRK